LDRPDGPPQKVLLGGKWRPAIDREEAANLLLLSIESDGRKKDGLWFSAAAGDWVKHTDDPQKRRQRARENIKVLLSEYGETKAAHRARLKILWTGMLY
jgi:hypothetical protein